MKLISMTDYLMELTKNNFIGSGDVSNEILLKAKNYANFLKQPLKLEMFVPCDENGNVLEEPDQEFELTFWDYSTKMSKYEQAKEKVLFEGFEYLKDVYHFPNEKCFKLVLDSEMIITIEENNTIEDLSFSNIYRLTTNAIKQLGL